MFNTLHIHFKLFDIFCILFWVKGFSVDSLWCLLCWYIFCLLNYYMWLVVPIIFRLWLILSIIILVKIFITWAVFLSVITSIVIHRCTHCLISSLLQDLGKYSHLVSLLSGMYISLKCSISAVEYILLFHNMILNFRGLIKLHLSMSCQLNLLFEIMVNLD